MKVPESLSLAFGSEFERLISDFISQEKLLPDDTSLVSNRFLARAVIPHILKLSQLFNREAKDQASSLPAYWKDSSNPQNLRLAYFLYFMPCNLFRMASIWAELSRLGFKWKPKHLQGIEFGAGPASGLCGIAAGETFAGIGAPRSAQWALIEQDQSILEMGARWAQTYTQSLGSLDWGIRTFHRKIDLSRGFLPKTAPSFNLWLMSYYLNELEVSPQDLAPLLLDSWSQHLEEEGLVILMEPALRLQSRKLLELRKALLTEINKKKRDDFLILLPCLGHQTCGALENPDDWCHEEVTWWRPPYLRKLDDLAQLDRKTLPFSYLVIMRTKRSRDEVLPALRGTPENRRHRLVSPAHSEGRDLEFFTCGQDGKKRARLRTEKLIQRGDILLGSQLRGDTNASRVEGSPQIIE
jgi:hypothetical protein